MKKLKNKSYKSKKVNKLAGLRLKTKAPAIFVDKKKKSNKTACRGKVKHVIIEKE